MSHCYFTYDERSGERVLVPGCWSVAISSDIETCTCKPRNFENRFERKEFNEILKSKEKEIIELQKEINRLNSRVEFWHKKFNCKK